MFVENLPPDMYFDRVFEEVVHETLHHSQQLCRAWKCNGSKQNCVRAKFNQYISNKCEQYKLKFKIN